MKKLLGFLFICIVFSGTFFTACTDKDLVNTTDQGRSYEQDAELLSKFVDIDVENGEFFLNTHKSSFFDLLPQSYKNELSLVSETNKGRFLQEMEELNTNIASVIQNKSSDYIVLSTPGKNATKQLNPASTIKFISNSRDNSTRTTSQSYNLSLTGYNGSRNYLDFNSGQNVDSQVDITASGGNSFFVTVRETKSSARPNGADPSNPYAITYAGYGYYSGTTRWTHFDSGSNLQWSLEAYITIPPMTGNAVFRPA